MRWGAARAVSPPELMDHFFALAFFVFFAFAFFAFLAIVSSSFAGRPLWRGRAVLPYNRKITDSVGLSAKEASEFLLTSGSTKRRPHVSYGSWLCRNAQGEATQGRRSW